MKNTFLFLLLLMNAKLVSAQTNDFEVEKLASLAKVWGYLKYYHPTVAKGTYNWDEELVVHIRQLANIHNKEELSKFYMQWISSIGKVPVCKKCNVVVPDSMSKNLNLDWIKDQTSFSDSLITVLKYIRQNRNTGSNHYIKTYPIGNVMLTENPYPGYVYPSYEYRLLSLFRYWNVINYFYPYKYTIGEDWNKVLTEMIPKFNNAKDTIAYHLAMQKLVNKLNDSHAFFFTPYIDAYIGKYYAPLKLKIIDGQVLVVGYGSYILPVKDELEYGDKIIKVDGKEISQVLKERLLISYGSNEPTWIKNASAILLNGSTILGQVTFERNGIVQTKEIRRYLYESLKRERAVDRRAWKILPGNIAYVDMLNLSIDSINSTMKALLDTKAIVFDLRTGAQPNVQYLIARYLNNKAVPSANFSYPSMNYPGTYVFKQNPYAGSKNKNYYKGKVVLLVNEYTQSLGEFSAMVLQTAPNVITIGSQTAGADGNVSSITFPGGYSSYISGLGFYYPDGTETQHKGVKIDIICKQTISGILNKQDEVLNRALTYIQNEK